MSLRDVLCWSVIIVWPVPELFAGVQVIVYDGDDAAPNAKVCIETLERNPSRILTGSTNPQGVCDAEEKQSLVSACEGVVGKGRTSETCRRLKVTASKGTKMAETEIQYIGGGWDLNPVKLYLEQPAGLKPGPILTGCADKRYYHYVPLYARETVEKWCQDESGVRRRVAETTVRIVGVKVEMVSGCQVPPGATIQNSTPDYAIPYLRGTSFEPACLRTRSRAGQPPSAPCCP
jgi:hypothetical protein